MWTFLLMKISPGMNCSQILNCIVCVFQLRPDWWFHTELKPLDDWFLIILINTAGKVTKMCRFWILRCHHVLIVVSGQKYSVPATVLEDVREILFLSRCECVNLWMKFRVQLVNFIWLRIFEFNIFLLSYLHFFLNYEAKYSIFTTECLWNL